MPHYKILVIDYEPRGVAQLRDPLHAAGYLVSVAHDGITGMKLFDEIQPDLTLIEAMLPKKHGFEVCRDLKKTPHGQKSPVVIVTSVYRGRKYRTQAFHNYHCDEFLEKPISSSTLLSTVERLLQERAARIAQPPPPAAEEPAPEPETDPARERKPGPAPSERQAAAKTVHRDEAEAEIAERLDELLGGGPDSDPRASTASSPRDENVISFDSARGRRSPAVPQEVSTPGGPRVVSSLRGGVRSGPATAGAVQAARAYPPVGDEHATPAPHARPETRRRDPREQPPRRGRQTRSRLVLLLTILFVALASSAVFLLLNWPF